jgi:DNA-binding HxlR family transcriptional regulator
MAKREHIDGPCPVGRALEVFGGKWKSQILYCLNTNGKHRFSELQKLIPKVSQKMLTQQLRELESDGLVSRRNFEEATPKVEYSRTKLSLTVIPIFEAITKWEEKHMDEVNDARTKNEKKSQ